MKKAFISSRYRGDIVENTMKARRYARTAIAREYLPIAPHLYFPQLLNDENPEERLQGILLGVELLQLCDEIWIIGSEISNGMELEIEVAKDLELQALLFDEDMNQLSLDVVLTDNRFHEEYRNHIAGLNVKEVRENETGIH